MNNIKNIASSLLAFALVSTQITACGGGSSTDVSSNTHPDEPIQVTASSWKMGQKTKTDNTVINIKTYHRLGKVGKPKHFSVKEIKKWIHFERVTKVANPKIKHHQIFIDSDNNPATGFQFDGELWSSQSGADYMIEDNQLYKAKTNDSTWNWDWDWVTTANHYRSKGKDVPGTITTYDRNGGKAYFKSLCNNLNVGYVGRDSNWNVVEFSPRANSLQEKTIDLCNVSNSAPVISLKGAEVIYIKLNGSFVDPGATASDREDGDLTSQITVIKNTVDTTKTGKYIITYQVVDNAGYHVQKSRSVKVIDSTDPIVINNKIDGSEWALADTLFKFHGNTGNIDFLATDTKAYMYFYVSSSHYISTGNVNNLDENWQIYIDSDNNSNTGFGTDIGKGYEYMIENGVLNQFQGTNPSAWSWKEIDGGVITAPRTTDSNGKYKGSIEIALDKSSMAGWSKVFRVKFTSLNSSWNKVSGILPLVPYTQKFENVKAYTPFQNDTDVSSIIKSGSKWFGIKGKSVLQDDGLTNITTVYTSPNSVSSLIAPISGKIQFLSLKSKGSQCHCNAHGNGRLVELHSYDSVSAINSVLLSDTYVSILQSMNNFFLASTHHRIFNSRNRYPTNYYKVDKNLTTYAVGRKYMGEYFDIDSVDNIANETFVKKGNRGGTPISKKITETIGVGLEDI